VTGQPDEFLERIARGIDLVQRGERELARRVLLAVWNDLGPDGDPLHRCAAAHTLADVQDNPHDELVWDLRALAAAAQFTDARATAGSDGPVLGFYPSLHLNLADVYRRLGARSPYLADIRRSLERIEGELHGVAVESVLPTKLVAPSERSS
jgi:hypothetical protein